MHACEIVLKVKLFKKFEELRQISTRTHPTRKGKFSANEWVCPTRNSLFCKNEWGRLHVMQGSRALKSASLQRELCIKAKSYRLKSRRQLIWQPVYLSAVCHGNLPAARLPAGDLSAGCLLTGSLHAITLPTGALPAGDLSADCLPTGSLPGGVLFTSSLHAITLHTVSLLVSTLPAGKQFTQPAFYPPVVYPAAFYSPAVYTLSLYPSAASLPAITIPTGNLFGSQPACQHSTAGNLFSSQSTCHHPTHKRSTRRHFTHR